MITLASSPLNPKKSFPSFVQSEPSSDLVDDFEPLPVDTRYSKSMDLSDLGDLYFSDESSSPGDSSDEPLPKTPTQRRDSRRKSVTSRFVFIRKFIFQVCARNSSIPTNPLSFHRTPFISIVGMMSGSRECLTLNSDEEWSALYLSPEQSEFSAKDLFDDADSIVDPSTPSKRMIYKPDVDIDESHLTLVSADHCVPSKSEQSLDGQLLEEVQPSSSERDPSLYASVIQYLLRSGKPKSILLSEEFNTLVQNVYSKPHDLNASIIVAEMGRLYILWRDKVMDRVRQEANSVNLSLHLWDPEWIQVRGRYLCPNFATRDLVLFFVPNQIHEGESTMSSILNLVNDLQIQKKLTAITSAHPTLDTLATELSLLFPSSSLNISFSGLVQSLTQTMESTIADFKAPASLIPIFKETKLLKPLMAMKKRLEAHRNSSKGYYSSHALEIIHFMERDLFALYLDCQAFSCHDRVKSHLMSLCRIMSKKTLAFQQMLGDVLYICALLDPWEGRDTMMCKRVPQYAPFVSKVLLKESAELEWNTFQRQCVSSTTTPTTKWKRSPLDILSSVDSEIEDYWHVKESLFEPIDPLDFWKNNQVRFPRLSLLARKFLALPIFSDLDVYADSLEHLQGIDDIQLVSMESWVSFVE